MDATLEAVGKRSLPSPAGVNLRLDDQIVCRQFTRNFLRLIRGARSFPSWRGDAKLLEQLFSLVLVNVHRGRVALSARKAAQQRNFGDGNGSARCLRIQGTAV